MISFLVSLAALERGFAALVATMVCHDAVVKDKHGEDGETSKPEVGVGCRNDPEPDDDFRDQLPWWNVPPRQARESKIPPTRTMKLIHHHAQGRSNHISAVVFIVSCLRDL